jgi:hypothetical protein
MRSPMGLPGRLRARISSTTVKRGAAYALTPLVFLYLFYVLGAWLSLRSGLADYLTRNTDDVKLHFQSGFSLWPGHFHVEGVRFAYLDHNVELEFRAQSATVELKVLPLLYRTVHIDQVRAFGSTYKMIHRVRDGQRNRDRLAAFPDTGFRRSRVYDGPKPPPSPKPLHVLVQSIDAELTEAWLLEYRLEGPLRARGGFELDRSIKVTASEVTFENGALSVGNRQIAPEMSCRLRATVGPLPRSGSSLPDILRATTGQADCRVPRMDLGYLRIYQPDSSRSWDASWSVETTVHLNHGRVNNSKASGTVNLASLEFASANLGGEAAFSARSDADGNADLLFDWTRSRPDSTVTLDRSVIRVSFLQPAVVWEPKLMAGSIRIEGLVIKNVLALAESRDKSARSKPLRVWGTTIDAVYESKPETPAESAARLPSATIGPGRVVTQIRGHADDGGTRFSCDVHQNAVCEYAHPSAGTQANFTCHEVTLGCAPLWGKKTDQGDSFTWSAKIESSELEWVGGRLRSRWSVEADNPRRLLKTILDPDLLGRLGLDLAPFGDTAAQLSLNRINGTWAATLANFQSGVLSGRGSAIFARALVSRWNIATPLGRFGIAQTPTGVAVSPFVSSDWDVLDYGSSNTN